MKKHKKHNAIVDDFENTKRKHLDKLATKMLKNQETLDKLKEKPINPKFLDNF
jgi:ribosome recycling factor